MRAPALFPWFSAVTALKYIGPAGSQALTRLLRPTRIVEETESREPVLRDLLFHLPTSLIDRRTVYAVAEAVPGARATVLVEIDEHKAPPRNRPRVPYRIAAHDDSGTLILQFFHVKGDYLARQLPVGSKQLISGMIELYHGVPTIAHPEMMADEKKSADVLKLTPNYPLSAGLSQKLMAKAVAQALANVRPLPEWLDDAFMQQQKFHALLPSLYALHQPTAEDAIVPESPARKRLAYDELLANQLALALARRLTQKQHSYAVAYDVEVEKRWRNALPFALTNGQHTILNDMRQDMAQGVRMVRLLQGDVGSGKTLLAFGAMAQVAANGLQAALMVPTDLLARQHLASLAPLAEAVGLRMALLSGKMRKAEQAAVRAHIAQGEIDLVIGTHALFQQAVDFHALGLIVVDEQHRFGVGQRMRLAAKGKAPHLLQMSATPIPRSLTMTLYGDMEISNLTERPPGRQAIDTRIVPIGRADDVIAGLARVMRTGEKAYWVCPLIEAPDEDAIEAGTRDLAAAEERYRALDLRFPGKVGLVHGRMKLAERERVMQGFAFGGLQLLVATTVIEVGVNVPDATVMVIEQAERFGLAQLHQLRGRIGRSDKASRCILLYEEPLSDISKARLTIVRQTNDGFRIAEEDLRLRGAGDMLGTKQTGMPEFILVDLAHHLPLLRIAHDDARLVLMRDPELVSPRGQALRLLLQLYEYDAAIAQLKSV